MAAVIGFLTLLVAHFLSLDGDTFIVLQAVLDTQFWLATHVVCINLGYCDDLSSPACSASLYILFAHVLSACSTTIARQQLTRMIYGTLCFAIFFSFVGTVLGGLWADDSWGRFWGWDPKENGALMIVLWNALVLHARWGGLVEEPRPGAAWRSAATSSPPGRSSASTSSASACTPTARSESSTAMWLLTFALSQAAIIALGLIPPRKCWPQERKI